LLSVRPAKHGQIQEKGGLHVAQTVVSIIRDDLK